MEVASSGPEASVSLRLRTLGSACCFFLIMAAYYVLKPVRESLFLDSEGYQSFPYVHLTVGLVTYFAAQSYDWLARRWSGGYLAVRIIPFTMAIIATFWLMVQLVPPNTTAFRLLVVWPYYVGVSLYAVFLVAIFWSLTHNAFLPDEGRKAYGIVGSGGILGSAVGAFLTHHLVASLGSVNLVLVSLGLLIPCAPLAAWLDRCRLERPKPNPTDRPRQTSWSMLFNDRYVAAMGLLVFLGLALAELGDHQNQRVLSETGWNRDQVTQFYGRLYGLTNLTGLFISLVLTRPIQVRFGPAPGLLLWQLMIIIKAVFMAAMPGPTTLFYTLSLEYAVHYSIYQSAKELLYTPTSEDVKFRAKTLIDTFIFRLGVCFGATWVLIWLRYASMLSISTCILILSIPTVWVAVWLPRRFTQLVAAKTVPESPQSPGGSEV